MAQTRLSSKDITVLSYLRKDARRSLTKISKVTGIPVSTIFDLIQKNKALVITKFTALLDFGVLGFATRASITIKVDRQDRDILQEYLLRHHSINSVFKITGGYDYLVEGIFQKIKDVDEFIDGLQSRFKVIEVIAYLFNFKTLI